MNAQTDSTGLDQYGRILVKACDQYASAQSDQDLRFPHLLKDTILLVAVRVTTKI